MTYVFTTYFSKMLDKASFLFYLKQLPPSMHHSILKLMRWQDRQASLFSKLLLIKGLAEFGLSKEVLRDIKYTPYNKPYLDGNINFNIAHSGRSVVCCIGQDIQLGIDVEELRYIEIDAFSNYINPTELKKILTADNITSSFFNYWTKMEAAIKADGRGLNISLDDILFNEDQAIISEKIWHLKDIDIRNGYLAHIASNKPIIDDIILRKIEFKNIKNSLDIPIS